MLRPSTVANYVTLSPADVGNPSGDFGPFFPSFRPLVIPARPLSTPSSHSFRELAADPARTVAPSGGEASAPTRWSAEAAGLGAARASAQQDGPDEAPAPARQVRTSNLALAQRAPIRTPAAQPHPEIYVA